MDTPATTTPAEERSSGALTFALLAVVLAVAVVFAFSSSISTDWYALFKTIHVMFAVAWVGGGVLLTTLAIVAERSDDPAEIAAVAR